MQAAFFSHNQSPPPTADFHRSTTISSLPPGDPDTVSLSPPSKSLCRTRMLATVCTSRSVLMPSNLHIRDVRNLTKCNEKPLLRSDTGATSDGSSMFASLQRASKFTGLRTFTAFCYACCQATSAPSPVTTPVTPSGRGSLNPTWRQHRPSTSTLNLISSVPICYLGALA